MNHREATEGRNTTRKRVARAIFVSVLVGGVAPYVIYTLAHERLGEAPSLLLGGLLPSALDAITFARHRRLDPLSTVSLAALLFGVILATTGGGPRVLLLKESAVTGVVGLGFLLSLLAERPAIFYLGRQITTGGVPSEVARFDAAWEGSPGMRARMRGLTVVWGAGLLCELTVRVALIFTLTTEQVLVAGPMAFYATLFCLIAWTVRAVRPLYERILP
jgi:hypothetical protein